MRITLLSLLATVTLAPALAGQAVPGHVYWVGFFQALPGRAAAYNQALTNIEASQARAGFAGLRRLVRIETYTSAGRRP